MPPTLRPQCCRIVFDQTFKSLHYVAHQSSKNGSNNNGTIELPPEPTTCCMSGCANCVWVEYAASIAKLLGDDGEKARDIVLKKIKDPNLRAFLFLELASLKHKK